MKLRMVGTVFVFLLSSTSAFAWWGVEFTSDSVFYGKQDVSVWVKVANTTELSALTIPIVVRSELGGAFWAGDKPVYCQGTENGVTWIYNTGEATQKELCTVYDGSSPEYFQIIMQPLNAVSFAYQRLRLDFDIAMSVGRFVFDTAAFPSGAGAIMMIDDEFPPVDHGPLGTGEAVFTKGIIEVCACDCFVKGDINHDGVANPVDVSWAVWGMIRAVLQYLPDRPLCPYLKGDVNCDGSFNPLDVQFLVQYIYKGQDALCEGCID